MTVTVRPVQATDYETLLQLNELAVPDVNSISVNTLASLHQESCFFSLATVSEVIAGLLLALPASASYESPNFLYFKKHYPQFVYVDRIIVSGDYRRLGIGRQLYGALFAQLPPDAQMVACEINLLPANPDSLKFHESLGFHEVGQQDTNGGSKRVSLQTRPPQTL